MMGVLFEFFTELEDVTKEPHLGLPAAPSSSVFVAAQDSAFIVRIAFLVGLFEHHENLVCVLADGAGFAKSAVVVQLAGSEDRFASPAGQPLRPA